MRRKAVTLRKVTERIETVRVAVMKARTMVKKASILVRKVRAKVRAKVTMKATVRRVRVLQTQSNPQ